MANKQGPKKQPQTREEARASLAANKGDRPARGRPPKVRAPGLDQALDQAAKVDVKGGTCPSCKKPTSDGDKFCASCGADLAANACAKCRKPMKPAATFCSSCGETRASKASTPAAPTLAQLAAEPARDGAGGAPKPGDPARPLTGEVVQPPPGVPAIPQARVLTREAAANLYSLLSSEMKKHGITELSPRECDTLGADLSDLIAFYVTIDPKHQILARFAINHAAIIAPRLMVAALVKRRKDEAERKAAAEKRPAAPVVTPTGATS